MKLVHMNKFIYMRKVRIKEEKEEGEEEKNILSCD